MRTQKFNFQYLVNDKGDGISSYISSMLGQTSSSSSDGCSESILQSVLFKTEFGKVPQKERICGCTERTLIFGNCRFFQFNLLCKRKKAGSLLRRSLSKSGCALQNSLKFYFFFKESNLNLLL